MFSLHLALSGTCPLLSLDELTNDYVNAFWKQGGYDGHGVTDLKFRRIKIILEVPCRPPTLAEALVVARCAGGDCGREC